MCFSRPGVRFAVPVCVCDVPVCVFDVPAYIFDVPVFIFDLPVCVSACQGLRQRLLATPANNQSAFQMDEMSKVKMLEITRLERD